MRNSGLTGFLLNTLGFWEAFFEGANLGLSGACFVDTFVGSVFSGFRV